MARLQDMPRGSELTLVHSGATGATKGDNPFVSEIDIDTTLPDIAGGANLGVGKKIFTFPSGVIRVFGAYQSVSIKQTQGNITADTPDVGLGTTIASGAVALLSSTAAFENILTGQTFADCDGTASTAHVATDLLIAAGDSHDVYLNVADGWAASGDDAAILRGKVCLLWAKIA